MDINTITQFLESRELSDFLFPWKILAFIISIFFLFGIGYYYKKQGFILKDAKRRITDFLSFQKFTPPKSFLNRSDEVWELLQKKDYRRAVLRGESLFHALLHRFGYLGGDLAEIVSTPDAENIPNVEDLRKLAATAEIAKKNKLYTIGDDEAKGIFNTFEDTLRKLDVITDEIED